MCDVVMECKVAVCLLHPVGVVERTQQPASQIIVVQVCFVYTCVEIAMFLYSEGVDGHSGATTGGGAA